MKIGIAGAGLLGRLLAFELLKEKHSITLFDRDDYKGQKSCAMSAGGMLAPLSEIENSDSDIYPLGLKSLDKWPLLLKQLSQPVFFQQAGSLITAHAQDYQELDRYRHLISRKLRDLTHEYQLLNSQQTLALEPDLTQISQSLYFPIEGQIDSPALMQALHNTLKPEINWQEKTEIIDVHPGRIITNNKTHHFDFAIDCRGLGAISNFPKLRGVRGELIELHAPAVSLHRPVRLLHPRYRLYVVPRPNHRYLIGASEIESNDMSPISVRSTLEFLTAVYSLHRGFSEARILKTNVNCRPTLPDNLPKIKYTEGFIAINGLYRHGFLIAPALTDIAIRLLKNNKENQHKLVEAMGA